jgi:hypothetical protein
VRRLAASLALLALATALLTALPADPAAARASAYTTVLRAYQANGSIPPCEFSSSELAAALRGIDAYGQQYFADFTAAVQTALAQRASGACTPGVKVNAGGSAPAPRTPLPASVTSPTDADIPAPILALAALTALLATAAGLGALARAGGWEPLWAARWRHAWDEAAYRARGGFADFADWWRSGR